MQWIKTKDKLPGAVLAIIGHVPIVSADVAVLFSNGDLDIANYDHEDSHWSLPNKGFEQPDCDPEYWCELPELPNQTRDTEK